MSTWAVQQAGTFNVASSVAASPWYDGGAQTALASIPQSGDTITNTGGFALTFTVDLPDVASVLITDTVWGVAGTFDESSRNTDPGVGNVSSGVSYLIQNVSKTGVGNASSLLITSEIIARRRNGAKQ